jgi:hypothetical protein
MNNLDKEIDDLMLQRQFLKIEINSNYGINCNVNSILFEKRDNITRKIKHLIKLKDRLNKINYLKNKLNETSMEM